MLLTPLLTGFAELLALADNANSVDMERGLNLLFSNENTTNINNSAKLSSSLLLNISLKHTDSHVRSAGLHLLLTILALNSSYVEKYGVLFETVLDGLIDIADNGVAELVSDSNVEVAAMAVKFLEWLPDCVGDI